MVGLRNPEHQRHQIFSAKISAAAIYSQKFIGVRRS